MAVIRLHLVPNVANNPRLKAGRPLTRQENYDENADGIYAAAKTRAFRGGARQVINDARDIKLLTGTYE